MSTNGKPKLNATQPAQVLPIEIRLPLPPVIDKYWAFPRGLTRPVITKIGNRYRADIQAIVWAQYNGRPPKLRGRLGIAIGVMSRDKRLADLDNYQKALFDSLEFAGLVENDKWFRDSRIYDIGVQAPGWVDVLIESADEHPLFDDKRTTAQ